MAINDASQQANRAGMNPSRLVVIFYLLSAIVCALFFEHIFGMLWAQLGWRDIEVIEGWKTSTFLGVGLSGAAAIVCYVHPTVHRLSMEVANELMKVTWPSWRETRTSTTAVVVASILAALVLFGIDTVAYKMMVDWLPTLWGKL
jgi:preprotein translocase subunit SecE